MVRIGDNRLSSLTRHAVTTQILHLPAAAAAMIAMIMKVASRKEAAP